MLLPSGCEQHPQGPGHRKELQGRFLTVLHLSLWEQARSHLGDEAIFQLQLSKTQTWLCIVFKSRSEDIDSWEKGNMSLGSCCCALLCFKRKMAILK